MLSHFGHIYQNFDAFHLSYTTECHVQLKLLRGLRLIAIFPLAEKNSASEMEIQGAPGSASEAKATSHSDKTHFQRANFPSC